MTGHARVRWGGPAHIVSGAITAVFRLVHPDRDALSPLMPLTARIIGCALFGAGSVRPGLALWRPTG